MTATTLPRRAVSKLQRVTGDLIWKVRWGGRPFAEYQRQHMDRWGEVDAREAVGGLWDEMGALQLRTMRAVGLEPQHRLLDLGAGSLRGGVHLIGYLDAGNYWGTDLSATLLAAGRGNLKQAGLAEKKPSLLISKAFGFEELGGELFDFVLAFGVFTDIPVDSVRDCLANLSRVLGPGGVFVATFALGSEYFADRSGLRFRYPWALLAGIAAEHDLSARLVRGFEHPKGHSLLVLRRG